MLMERAVIIWKRKKIECNKLGRAFDLTVEWIDAELSRNRCAVTDIKFEYINGGRRLNPFSPQIDRIDPKLGYIMENCRMVCAMYNMAKSDWTHEEVRIMAKALLRCDEQRSSEEINRNKLLFDEAMRSKGIAHTARYFGVSRQTIYDWLKRGAIPGRYAKIAERYAIDAGVDKRELCPEAF